MKIIHTPGHSEGSVCFLIEKLCFSGDTIFAAGIGRTDFEGGDENKMRKSILHLKNILEGDVLILPGHGESAKMKDAIVYAEMMI